MSIPPTEWKRSRQEQQDRCGFCVWKRYRDIMNMSAILCLNHIFVELSLFWQARTLRRFCNDFSLHLFMEALVNCHTESQRKCISVKMPCKGSLAKAFLGNVTQVLLRVKKYIFYQRYFIVMLRYILLHHNARCLSNVKDLPKMNCHPAQCILILHQRGLYDAEKISSITVTKCLQKL